MVPENEFEQRLYQMQSIPAHLRKIPRSVVQPSEDDLNKPDLHKSDPQTGDRARIYPNNAIPSSVTLDRQPQPPAPLDRRIEQVLPPARLFNPPAPRTQQLDQARSWRAPWTAGRDESSNPGSNQSLVPNLRRILSAGRLLFQVVGVAGYAGYFMGMHTLMRIVSGTLMAAAWYALYRVKGHSSF